MVESKIHRHLNIYYFDTCVLKEKQLMNLIGQWHIVVIPIFRSFLLCVVKAIKKRLHGKCNGIEKGDGSSWYD